ncbi:MAG: citrate synthase [Firmicutes bacterium]|nr:citrate synthase [Bacillota bacterium]
MAKEVAFPSGLEDVVAANSSICFIDGKEGRLLYHGYDINDLAENSTFEETIYLLWHGELPTKQQLEEHEEFLRRHRRLPRHVVAHLYIVPDDAVPMEVLRTASSILSLYDEEAEETSEEAHLHTAARIVARLPAIVAVHHRLRSGYAPVGPREDLSFAANFLWMLTGTEPDPLHVKVMDSALILHADHELNASTFAARVTAATLSDTYSAITAAISALKGPLHGGANERVMHMLREIGDPDKAEAWVKERLARKEKIMGFGHRVYKTADPRAMVLKRYSKMLGEYAGDTRWYEISCVIEEVMAREKGLYPNVDFYAASTYQAMGIPTDLYTPIFACSRAAGWTAHVIEQYANNRLIRPRAEYVGPALRPYTPIDEREVSQRPA